MPEFPIRILDQIVIDQIAAGEVVSRPASVVKELLENALDAGAGVVTIDIVGGGVIAIMVTDDGKGIPPDQLSLAITRHATSKLQDISDLNTLGTLGFRGEALASIASVSRFKVTSKSQESEDPTAYFLECNGGQISDLKKTARNVGSTIEVLDLFYNVPARRKFLKKEITEFGHIAEVVEKFILSFPQVRFTLTHNGKKIYVSPGTGILRDAITCVWPRDISAGLIELNYSSMQIGVRGYVSNLTTSRSDKNLQIFFVNQRHVYNPTLAKALEDAYRNILENHRYALCVLFVELDPATIDVNVHPAKREIKFADTSLVYNTLKAALIKTLSFVPESQQASESIAPFKPASSFPPETMTHFPASPAADRPSQGLFRFPSVAPFPEQPSRIDQSHVALHALAPPERMATTDVKQVMSTYLVCEQDHSLVIYDQHALHERILFEKLRAAQTDIAAQRLLVPEMIFLSKSEMIKLEEYKDIFMSTGFELEFFGPDCVLLRSIPSFMRIKECVEMFGGIMADIMAIRCTDTTQKIQDDIYKIIACRSAVKAGDNLSPPEIYHLLAQIPLTPNVQTCPHGRPTTIQFSRKDLDKLFHRI